MADDVAPWNLLQIAFIVVYPAWLSFTKMPTGMSLLAAYIFLFVLCVPPVFIQLKIGNHQQKGIVGLLAKHIPIMKGIGITLLIQLFLICVYMVPLVTHYGVYAFIAIAKSPYVWGQCDNAWNRQPCQSHIGVNADSLLSRVKEEPNGFVEVNKLYTSFEFEMVESGVDLKVPKMVFLGHILKVFPNARKERKTGNTNSKVTTYHGITLLPIESFMPVKSITIKEIKGFLANDVTVTDEHEKSIKCTIDSHCTSNGNRIVKVITFFDNGEWALEVSGVSIDLQKLYISSTFSGDQNGIDLVVNAARKIALCVGVELSKNVIMTRFHILDTWQSEDIQGKRLRSVVCNRVVPMNSMGSTCVKCQKMTFNCITPKDGSEKENNTPISSKSDVKSNINNSIHNKVSGSAVSKDDVKKMIPGATDEMVELVLSQAQNASRDPRGRRWTQGMISVCLQWFCRSPHSYEAFRATQYLVLPSRSTLIQYKSRVKHEVGFDDSVFSWMYEEAKRKDIPIEGYTGGLIIDEMSIQSDIQICKNGDIVELTGFMDVGEEGNLSNIMRKGKNEKVLGTHALQLVFLGVTGFRFPIAHFISDGIQAYGLYPLFWEAVDRLRMFGFNTVYTCMDGAQCNRTFMHINIGASTTYTTQCPCNFANMIFMMDSKHVIKKIRNNIIKSGTSKSSTRLLTLETSHTIQWQMFIDCYKWDTTNALQLHRKLTNEHLYPSNQQKMRNHLAEDVLDSEMLNLMMQYQKYLGEKGCVLNGVIEILKMTSKMINIFKDMRPVKTADDPRLEELSLVAQWFANWKTSALNKASVKTKDRGKRILSLQCHEDIQSCIVGFIQLCKMFLKNKSTVYITPALINSDVVENTFNQQRSTYHGANANPNALQYRRALNSIVLGQKVVSQKANAGKNRAAALPYDFSLKQYKTTKRKSEDNSAYSKIKVIRM